LQHFSEGFEKTSFPADTGLSVIITGIEAPPYFALFPRRHSFASLSAYSESSLSQAANKGLLLPAQGRRPLTINGCRVSACSYSPWSRPSINSSEFLDQILLVRYDNHPAGHAYCFWETAGTI